MIWKNLSTDNLFTQNALITLDWAYSGKLTLFAVVQGQGVFTRESPSAEFLKQPLLEIPWRAKKPLELLDRIYSYFDHASPLLGYYYYKEPDMEKGTTVNYLGHSASMPHMYYSSHDGYDFTLPYGAEVLAAAAGIASYSYDADGLGNHIKIDHLNGYQTTYAHLQRHSLITDTPNQNVQVTLGQVIGKVGMTGRTTGPHLHFSVEKDTNGDGKFEDSDVGGKSDPFGWQNDLLADPWSINTWSDTLGTHNGTISYYNWLNPQDYHEIVFVKDTGGIVQKDKWKITFSDATSYFDLVLKFVPSSVNPLTLANTTLSYIPETAFVLNAYSLAAETITKFSQHLNIEIDLASADLSKLAINTIKVYFFNSTSNVWEPLQSTLNVTSRILTAQSDHLTSFAVFGEKIDKNPPNTQIYIEGIKDRDWYVEFPSVGFTAQDNDTLENTPTIYYSLDNGNNWEIFTAPITLNRQGMNHVMYRAEDQQGNLEPTNEITIKIDTMNQYRHFTNKIVGAKFGT